MTGDHTTELVDTLGIGFGPAAMAIAAALEDEREAGRPARDVRFLERREEVRWQPGLLLPGANIQHQFLRDLATPRNPRSRFTFANYLKEHDRIFEFGELTFGGNGCGSVSRLEWSHYVQWVGRQLADWVWFGQDVQGVECVIEDGVAVAFELRTAARRLRCRNLIVSSGPVPIVPDVLSGLPWGRVVHSANYLDGVLALQADGVRDVAVIGSGQSAVEVVIDLHRRFPDATIHAIQRGVGFRQVDRCQFSNSVFHPAAVDQFHALPSAKRRELLAELRPLNYGVVDNRAASTLFRHVYQDKILGRERVRCHTFSDIDHAHLTDDGRVRMGLVSKLHGMTTELDLDLVVASTGYRESLLPPWAENLTELLLSDDDGAPMVTRDYEVLLNVPSIVQVFAAGTAEESHGPSDGSSFSMVAERAGRIANQLPLAGEPPPVHPRFVGARSTVERQ